MMAIAAIAVDVQVLKLNYLPKIPFAYTVYRGEILDEVRIGSADRYYCRL